MNDVSLAEENVETMMNYLKQRFAITDDNIKYLKNATKAELA